MTLHGFHEAVRNAVGHNELEVLALVVVLEVVVVLIRRHKAVVGLGSNICKEGKIELMVVNLWISCQTPVQQEVTLFLQLGNAKLEWLELIV